MSKRGRFIIWVLAVVAISAMGGPAPAVEVLEPGYVVETYASYACPAEAEPRGITFDSYGNLYVSNWDDYPYVGSIYKIAPDGTVSRWVEGLGSPRQMVWGGGTEYGDYVYVADATPCDVLAVNASGIVSTFCHVSAGPQSLAIAPPGAYGESLYVATRNPDHIYSVSPAGTLSMFSWFPGSTPGGHVDLAFDPGTDYGGYMYAALAPGYSYDGPYGVYKIDQSGNATEFAPALITASDVEFDPHGLFGGSMFVTGKCAPEQPYYALWRAGPDGSVGTFAVGTFGTQQLISFTFGPDGYMYIAEYSITDQTMLVSRIIPTRRWTAVDVKPGACPNPVNLASRGVLPVAILGSEDFDVSTIDVATIRLVDVPPVRSNYEDVGTPVIDGNECACNTEGPDGYTDLTLKFKTQAVVERVANTLGELTAGEELALTVTGSLADGMPIEGSDCIKIVGKVPGPLAAKVADLNADGTVNLFDFCKMAQHWLEPAVGD